MVSTARCMAAVTGMCVPLCHTSTGPRMRKSTSHATNAPLRRDGLRDSESDAGELFRDRPQALLGLDVVSTRGGGDLGWVATYPEEPVGTEVVTV